MVEEYGTDGRKKECVTCFGGENCREWTVWKKQRLWTNIEVDIKNVKFLEVISFCDS